MIKIFCKHKNKRLIRKIYGDEINRVNGKRYEYKCNSCGKILYYKEEQDKSCSGCNNLWYNCCGQAECLKNMEKICSKNNFIYKEEL